MKYRLLILSILIFITSFSHADDQPHYRVVISFASVCCGTNTDDSEAIDRYIQDYQTRHALFLKVVNGSYGDEGDFNYCYQLYELNQQQQVTFIAGLKKTLSEQKQTSERTSNSGVSWVTEQGSCLGFN